MRPIEPLPLHHSWPLADLREHLSPVLLDPAIARNEAALAERGLGLWHCDLADNRLRWTAGVYDLFGLERASIVPRPLAVSLYAPDSRDPMERLRAYAIRHKRGFTLDVDIHRAGGAGPCAMRLVAAPVLDGRGHVVALRGVKQLLPQGTPPSRRLEPTIFVTL
ncbi:diguanylate cyclase [Sphingobium sp. BYY-5]|uniref:diguanylate cyclase n=1 Tax=Sphingobium sp. BYY-5 TaxID=2926400 RepID=UPI001FA6F790|nr:diguanylate cyclase [Sphingobium sp. BYY-5]MCI4590631.1 diguanylate cyclase [Sphingobium sp. BYY-5]